MLTLVKEVIASVTVQLQLPLYFITVVVVVLFGFGSTVNSWDYQNGLIRESEKSYGIALTLKRVFVTVFVRHY